MANNFLLVERKDDEFPKFHEPVIIGLCSIDENREYSHNSKNLQYLCRFDKKVKFDLNLGFKDYTPKHVEEKLDTILKWLYYEKKVFDNILKEEKCRFICFRGVLTTIMRTPYEKQEDWLIFATKVKNMIFLCAYNTPDKKKKLQEVTSKDKRFTYWGCKFEQYMTSEHPARKPNISKKLNINEEMVVLYNSQLDHHHLLYAAEVDAVDSSDYISDSLNLDLLNRTKFVELKTSRFIESKKHNFNFKRFKSLKWWSQSFMVGIEDIICGFRDDDGIVHELEVMNTKDLPKNAEWKPSVCMVFLNKFLTFVKNTLEREVDFSHWKFYWKPGFNKIYPEKQNVTLESQYSILPDWFVEEYEKCTHQMKTKEPKPRPEYVNFQVRKKPKI